MSKIKLYGNTGSAHVAKRAAGRGTGAGRGPSGRRGPSRKRRPGRGRRALIAAAIILALLIGLYCLAVFSDIPFIAKWRTIYIQTAMDTMNHQWLATAFIPGSVIDEAMAEREQAQQEQTEHSSSENWAEQGEHPVRTPKPTAKPGESDPPETEEPAGEEEFYELFWEIDRESMEAYLEKHPEALDNGWDGLYINEAGLDDDGTSIQTAMGEQVLAVDVPNELLLVRVKGTGYRGVLAIGKDPSRLSVKNSAYLGSIGQYAGDIASDNNGVLAMTASGFEDEGGVGLGGTLNGYAMSDGKGTGAHLGWSYKRIELREDNYMYIVDAQSPVDPETTDAVEFTPAIIVDGQQLNTSGYSSLQPRAVIGQSDRGEILMLVVEGRLIDSIGISVADCGKILMRHNCMQAMNLDGGTSAMLWYDGEYIIRCSNQVLPYGRTLPNAFVYAKG